MPSFYANEDILELYRLNAFGVLKSTHLLTFKTGDRHG